MSDAAQSLPVIDDILKRLGMARRDVFGWREAADAWRGLAGRLKSTPLTDAERTALDEYQATACNCAAQFWGVLGSISPASVRPSHGWDWTLMERLWPGSHEALDRLEDKHDEAAAEVERLTAGEWWSPPSWDWLKPLTDAMDAVEAALGVRKPRPSRNDPRDAWLYDGYVAGRKHSVTLEELKSLCSERGWYPLDSGAAIRRAVIQAARRWGIPVPTHGQGPNLRPEINVNQR
jgi:hypothetical protein